MHAERAFLTGYIGAEVVGVDLRQPMSQDLAPTLRDALARHQVPFLRDRQLPPGSAGGDFRVT